jgi:hypothetical protein
VTKQAEAENIAQVKTALADKYERLARGCKSRPAKARLQRHSERFRAQAKNAAEGNSK